MKEKAPTTEDVVARKLAALDKRAAATPEEIGDELAVQRARAEAAVEVAKEEPLDLDAVKMMAIVKEAEEQASEQLVEAACAMFNRMLEVDPVWTRTLVSAMLPVSPNIAAAASVGAIAMELSEGKDGKPITGVLGMVNAFLLHCGCENKVAANVAVLDGKAMHIASFEPWVRRDQEGDE